MPDNFLEVTVQFNAEGSTVDIDTNPITLTDAIDYVVWTFTGLPEGASPEISFADGGSGPFQELVVSLPDKVFGGGNRGPVAGGNFYGYQAIVSVAEEPVASGAGLVINEATGPKSLDDLRTIGPDCSGHPWCQ